MFTRVEDLISQSEATENITTDREDPKTGIVYFQLSTDDTFEEQLKYFQPENSAVVVEDGEIVEFDVRLGRWAEGDKEETMQVIEEAVAKSRREHYVPPLKVDTGGSHGFVPHIRIYNSRVVEEEFVNFLESLVTKLRRMDVVGK